MPVRSAEEFSENKQGGEAEQHCQGIARSLSNPERIYLSHDCGQVWKSTDAGDTWQKTLGKGLYALAGQSIEVDPVNPDIVFAVMDNTWDWMNENFQGLYRSRDGGDTWDFVLPVAAAMENSRRYEHNIACDRASIGSGGARRWYAAFTGDALYRSDDAGATWQTCASLAGLGALYSVQTHPRDGTTVFVASGKGLFISRGKGSGLQPAGNLPPGEVSSLAVNPVRPEIVYAVLMGQGLYASADGGGSFELLKKFSAEHVFINPGFPEELYLVGAGDSLFSDNGGRTWEAITLTPAPGLWREYKKRMVHALSGVVPNPKKPQEAVAFTLAALWKTRDGARFNDSSTFFTGYNTGWWNRSIAFDIKNPERFALCNADVGLAITENRGAFFYRRGVPIEWRSGPAATIPWTSMHGAGLQPGTDTIVSAAGNTWKKKLVRSEDAGRTWKIVDDDFGNYLFIAFHPLHANIVYADNKKSTDGGKTFAVIECLKDKNAAIMGMCSAHPDTVYALDKERKTVFRSDDQGATWRTYAAAGWSLSRHDSKPTFSVDPENCDRVYSIDARGDLAVFDGHAWKSLGLLDAAAGSAKPKNFVRAVEVDTKHPDILYAGMHAPGTETMWRSTDGGATWQDITFNLPRLGIGSININPHSGEVMAGGCCGTWVFPPPYASENLIYDTLVPRPSCKDGLKNGTEQGVDCGNGCTAACN